MPKDEKSNKKDNKTKNVVQTKNKSNEGFGLEIGSLVFSSDVADIELKNIKIHASDAEEFRKLLLDISEQL